MFVVFVVNQFSADRQPPLAAIAIAHGVDPIHRQIYKRLLQLNAVGADLHRPIWPVGIKFDSVPAHAQLVIFTYDQWERLSIGFQEVYLAGAIYSFLRSPFPLRPAPLSITTTAYGAHLLKR